MNQLRQTISIVLRLLLLIAAMYLLLFLPAGNLWWTEGWILIGIIIAYSVIISLYLMRFDPELLQERMRSPIQKEQVLWDKVLIGGLSLISLAIFPLAGLDYRYHWSDTSLGVHLVGIGVSIVGFFFASLTLRENAYLARTVKIQEGQEIITTGPYSYIRHPMYVGVSLVFFGFPLVLRSLIALIPAVISIGLLMYRSILEEKTLEAEFETYTVYKNTVRYRFLPKVW